MNKIPKEQEETIDVFEITDRIRTSLIRCGRSILKHKIRMLLFVFLFGVAGGVVYVVAPTYYKADMLVENNVIDNTICKQLINGLQSNIKPSFLYETPSNSKGYEKYLKISPEMASKIRSITYDPINEKYERLFKDSLSKTHPFAIKIKVYDTTVISQIGKPIISYLKNTPYIQHELEKKLTFYSNNIKDLEKRIKQLDTAQKVMISQHKITPTISSNGINISTFDPANIAEKEVELFHKKEKYLQKAKSLKSGFVIIKPFSPYEVVKSSLSITSLVLYGVLIGCFLGLISIYLMPKQKRD